MHWSPQMGLSQVYNTESLVPKHKIALHVRSVLLTVKPLALEIGQTFLLCITDTVNNKNIYYFIDIIQLY